MKSKLNPISIGSFVIGTLILLVVGLLSFKSLYFFNKPLRFVCYFDESVQGLDVGSRVKLRGVPVGSVVSIKVQYDWKENKSEVMVVGEIEKNAIVDRSGHSIQVKDDFMLQPLVDQGLRAKVDLIGITGVQFVQLDFFDPKKNKPEVPDGRSPYPAIPTMRSGISQLKENLLEVADHLKEVDFKKMTLRITDAAEAIEGLASYIEQHPSSLIFGRRSKQEKK